MNQNKTERPKGTTDARARGRSAGQPVEKKRRGLFLIIDVLLLIGIVGTIFLLILTFTPLTLFGDKGEPCEVLYTLEFKGVDQSFLSSFSEGGSVLDTATGSRMGEIVQIKIREYEEYTSIPTPEIDPEFGKHVVRKETNENLKTVTVVLRVTAEYTKDVGYMAQECRIAVGAAYSLRFPSPTGGGSYTDDGVCIALNPMNGESEVAANGK